jgi:hypothetical protein
MTGLADALEAEYAAVFGYGVVGSHVAPRLRTAAKQAERAHRNRRDQLLGRLEAKGVTPPAAEPAYRLPFEVSDPESAVKLGRHLEERVAAVWQATLGATRGADRRLALEALIDAAVRASRWRTAMGAPATVPLPGAPD